MSNSRLDIIDKTHPHLCACGCGRRVKRANRRYFSPECAKRVRQEITTKRASGEAARIEAVGHINDLIVQGRQEEAEQYGKEHDLPEVLWKRPWR